MAASITKIVILVTTQMIWHTTRMLPRDTGSIGTSGFAALPAEAVGSGIASWYAETPYEVENLTRPTG